jgi:hypothetical protein
MSLKIGGSKSNSSGSSNTTTNSTTTPIVPDWASNLTQSVAGRVGGLLNGDPQSQVAPSNALQNVAGASAGMLSGQPWNFEGAADLYRGVADRPAPSISANIGQFMAPYTNDVVNATSADLDSSDGKVRAAQNLALAGSGAFGGSGAALTQSATEGELARARATTLGALRSQGFAQALGGAEAQAQLQANQQQQRLAAAQGLVNQSTAYDANQRANIASQLSTGDDLRNISQEQLQAPQTSTAQIVAMLSGLPINLFTGQQSSGTSNTQSKGAISGVNVGASFGDDAGKAVSKLLGL